MYTCTVSCRIEIAVFVWNVQDLGPGVGGGLYRSGYLAEGEFERGSGMSGSGGGVW